MGRYEESCPPMKMEQMECFEMSAYKIQTLENCPEESIQQLWLDLRVMYCMSSVSV